MLDADTAAKLQVKCTWNSVIDNVLAKDITAADKAFKDILEMLDTTFNTSEFTWKLRVQDDFEKIVRLFHEIDVHEVAKYTDVLGFIYEQHISTGAGRDLGKFYTDRQITRYLTELLGSDISGGRPDSMCDATMGTGGFILSYIEYVTKKCKDVKWDDYDLAGGDIDDKVAAIARLNVFLRTGKLFPMIRKRNTLKNDIGDSSDKRRTFKRLLMSIPFGVKGLTLAEDCCERVKEIVKAGTKSEPLFVTLATALLAEGGRAAIIVPDGLFVNCSKQHDTLRKYLLDNFKILRVIKMRGKFFMNTGIQPSVIVFERSGKTEEVEFWDVEKLEGGELVETCMLKVARAKLDESCSFDMRRYQETKAVANSTGFPVVKLGEYLEDVKTGKNTNDLVKGDYPFYMSNGISQHVSTYQFDGEYVLTGRCGSLNGSQYYVNGKFSASDFTYVLKPKKELSAKYLYYCMRFVDWNAWQTGTTLKNIRREVITGYDMPLPPLAVQQEVVEALDLVYGGAEKAKEVVSSIKGQMRAMIQCMRMRGFPDGNLGDMLSFMNGYAFKSEEFLSSGVPVLKITNIKNNGVSFEKAQYVKQDAKLAKFVVKPKDMIISLTGYPGDVGINLTGVDWYLNQRVARIDVTSPVLNAAYVYYYMVYSDFTESVRNLSTGSAQANVSTKNIEMMTMPVPPLAVQEEIVERLHGLQAQLTSLEAGIQAAEVNARFILNSYVGGEGV